MTPGKGSMLSGDGETGQQANLRRESDVRQELSQDNGFRSSGVNTFLRMDAGCCRIRTGIAL